MAQNSSAIDALRTATLATEALDKALAPSLSLKQLINQSTAVSRAMEEAIRPLRAMDEIIKSATDPLFGMNEAVHKTMLAHLAAVSDAMRHASYPFAGMSEALRRVTDPWPGISEATRKAFADHSAGVLEVMRRASDPLMGMSEAIQNATMSLDSSALGISRALESLRIQNEMLDTAIAGLTLKTLSISNIVETWFDPFGANFQGITLASRTLAEAIKVREEFRVKNTGTDVQIHSLLLDSLAVIEESTATGIAPDKVKRVFPRLLTLLMTRLERATSIFEQQRLMGVITVLSFFLMLYYEAQGDAQHQAVMEGLALISAQTQLIEHLREDWAEYANGAERTLAVIMRRANLRPSPDTKGKRLALLHEAEVVEFLELSNDWAKVRYFDAMTDGILEGWVYSRFIRVMPRD